MSHSTFLKPHTVAVFALDGEVQLYAETLRYLAWKLAGAGARVVRFGCSGVLGACTSLNSTNKSDLIAQGKAPVCSRCKIAQAKICAEVVFEVAVPDLPVSPPETAFLSEVRNRLHESRRIETVLDMSYDEIEIPRIAFFDFAIVTKLSHLSTLDDISLMRFIAGVEDQIMLLRALRRFQEAEKITHVLYVNGNYSQNTLVRIFFARRGVECVSVEPQLTSQRELTKILLAKDRLVLEPEGLLPAEAASHDKPASMGGVREVLRNFGARIDGGDFNAYTSLTHDKSSIEELQKLNAFLKSHSRTHAFFLSSEDELTPHILTHNALNGGDFNSPGGFRSQAEFTNFLFQEAGRYPEIGFVIRLHPRMAVNKRDRFESEEHIKYKQILSGISLPKNVFVLYGDSKISSYYVISEVDLVIIAWSTIGLEAMLLGAPVISVFPACLMYPLAAFSKQPQEKLELEAALFETTDFGLADDDVLLRWLAQGFEKQFFATAAPRGKGGMLDRVYRGCYQVLSRFGMYGVAAGLVSLLPSARVRLDERRLMVTRGTKRGVTKAFVKRSIEQYRKKYISALVAYGEVRS